MKKFFLLVLVLALLALPLPATVSAETIYDCHNDGGLVSAPVAEKASVACERFEHEREFKSGQLYFEPK